jgi:hypothetical protein
MKTTRQVMDQSDIPKRLINAVVRQLGGKDSLEDICNHGIDGGFHGFIYYNDTIAFYKRNRSEIVALVNQMAEELGENPIDMIAGFNCLAGQYPRKAGNYGFDTEFDKARRELYPSISRCLYGRITDEDTQVANALAWFAGEEVARAYCDE